LFDPRQLQTSSGADFNVVIAGTAPTAEGSLVHAVTVLQPVQTWTVIRAQSNFVTMQSSLAAILRDVPPCPHYDGSGGADALVEARHQLQRWLLSVLMLPGARESPAIGTFLTEAANIIPPQYENATWTMFDASGQVVNPSRTTVASPAPAPAQTPAAPGSEFTMDMDMMMMDEYGDDGGAGSQLEESEEQENEYRASERYQPTDEPLTAQDVMEMANMAAEVEMIEDVGSLAQSLGASHIGRSLMRQDEMGRIMHPAGFQQHQFGVQVGTSLAGMGTGGIGSAMANATPGIGNSFSQTSPECPPRLDSFKMIKVIGKGSFGESGVGKVTLSILVLSHILSVLCNNR